MRCSGCRPGRFVLTGSQQFGLRQGLSQSLAGRSGQLLNLSGLGADAGISHHTVREWLSVLEGSYVIQCLNPAHRTLSKRLVKSPKLHLLPTGLSCWLLGSAPPNSSTAIPCAAPCSRAGWRPRYANGATTMA